jgi:hypothetical protein
MPAKAGTSDRKVTAGPSIVIPAKAGTSGRKVTAGLAEIPAFAGMTLGAGMTPTRQ